MVQDPMSSYSKGAQGLSVFLRGDGIFTANSISLSLWLRQCGDRYAIRAGRNLPDKEFRYLRTVIVTAALSLIHFAEPPVETAPKSLRLSCRSELTRQGISLP